MFYGIIQYLSYLCVLGSIHYIGIIHVSGGQMYYSLLTHLPLDKMAEYFADDIFKCIFIN